MRNIAPLPAEGKFAAIGGLGSVAGFEKNTREAVDRWIQENPNAAETVEALVNVLPFAKVKNLTKAAKPGKAAVSGDFSKSYTCSFHGSTLVKTADGYKAIAHIQAGDRVLSKDEASGETGYKPVTARYGNPYQETVYIEVSDGIGNSQTLISNRIHPFYSDGKWIKAEDLKAGSRLLSESGRTQTVRNTVVKPKPLKAYNLTVADWHTYFVKGSQAETEGVWVHNDCPYGNLSDNKSVGEGKKFTPAQKKAIIQENMNRNGGVVKSDQSGEVLVRPKKSQKGITPPSNEWQIDHVQAKSKGGSNSYKNAQVLSRRENIKKSNK
ncbi:TPA: MafB family polymorphic toxin, partial [Neisseria gonorrhoeae]